MMTWDVSIVFLVVVLSMVIHGLPTTARLLSNLTTAPKDTILLEGFPSVNQTTGILRRENGRSRICDSQYVASFIYVANATGYYDFYTDPAGNVSSGCNFTTLALQRIDGSSGSPIAPVECGTLYERHTFKNNFYMQCGDVVSISVGSFWDSCVGTGKTKDLEVSVRLRYSGTSPRTSLSSSFEIPPSANSELIRYLGYDTELPHSFCDASLMTTYYYTPPVSGYYTFRSRIDDPRCQRTTMMVSPNYAYATSFLCSLEYDNERWGFVSGVYLIKGEVTRIMVGPINDPCPSRTFSEQHLTVAYTPDVPSSPSLYLPFVETFSFVMQEGYDIYEEYPVCGSNYAVLYYYNPPTTGYYHFSTVRPARDSQDCDSTTTLSVEPGFMAGDEQVCGSDLVGGRNAEIRQVFLYENQTVRLRVGSLADACSPSKRFYLSGNFLGTTSLPTYAPTTAYQAGLMLPDSAFVKGFQRSLRNIPNVTLSSLSGCGDSPLVYRQVYRVSNAGTYDITLKLISAQSPSHSLPECTAFSVNVYNFRRANESVCLYSSQRWQVKTAIKMSDQEDWTFDLSILNASCLQAGGRRRLQRLTIEELTLDATIVLQPPNPSVYVTAGVIAGLILACIGTLLYGVAFYKCSCCGRNDKKESTIKRMMSFPFMMFILSVLLWAVLWAVRWSAAGYFLTLITGVVGYVLRSQVQTMSKLSGTTRRVKAIAILVCVCGFLLLWNCGVSFAQAVYLSPNLSPDAYAVNGYGMAWVMVVFGYLAGLIGLALGFLVVAFSSHVWKMAMYCNDVPVCHGEGRGGATIALPVELTGVHPVGPDYPFATVVEPHEAGHHVEMALIDSHPAASQPAESSSTVENLASAAPLGDVARPTDSEAAIEAPAAPPEQVYRSVFVSSVPTMAATTPNALSSLRVAQEEIDDKLALA